jgi:hypothetical protein
MFFPLQVKKDEAAAAKVRAVVQKEEAVAKKEAAETEAIKADAQADLDQVCAAHIFKFDVCNCCLNTPTWQKSHGSTGV